MSPPSGKAGAETLAGDAAVRGFATATFRAPDEPARKCCSLPQQWELRYRQLLQLHCTDLGMVQVEACERVDDGGRDDDTSEPLIVGRHDVPWRVRCGGVPDHLLMYLHEVVPNAHHMMSLAENFQFFPGSSSRSRK